MAKPKQTTLGEWWARARDFVEELPLESVATRPVVRRVRTTAQFFYLVVRGCIDNRFPMRAAALSFTTLLAMVPLLAVAFSIAKSFLRDSSAQFIPQLLDRLVSMVAPQLQYLPGSGSRPAGSGQIVVSAEARQQAVEQIQTFLTNIDAGALGTIGTVFLAVVAIRLLMTIEQTFNDIWGVSRGRSIWRKVVYYWASVTLGPLLLVAAMVVTGASEFSHVIARLELAPWFGHLVVYGTPFVLLWLGFSSMYGLMPNTQVRASAAIAGGVVGGTLWQVNSLLSTLYLSRVVTYSKIYGGLGIIPVFLLGLYFSWLIVLFGAQVSFAAQNVRNYLQQRASERVDQAGRELVACRAVLAACRAFLAGEAPPSVQEIADRIGAPVHLLNRLANRLTEGDVLRAVTDRQTGLIPARPPDAITVADVLRVVRTSRGSCGERVNRESSEPVEQLLTALDDRLRKAPENATFHDLASSNAAPKA